MYDRGEKNMITALRKFWQIVTLIFVAIAAILVILLAGTRLIGLTPYTVISGSMEPIYHVGSVIYVKDANPEAFKKGDIVTYRMDGTVVTHRINDVKIDSNTGGVCYQTKGDANNMPDGPVLYPESIIGKPVFTIPILGYIADFVQKPPGTFLVIGICALLVFLSTLSELIFGEEKIEKTDSESDKP